MTEKGANFAPFFYFSSPQFRSKHFARSTKAPYRIDVQRPGNWTISNRSPACQKQC